MTDVPTVHMWNGKIIERMTREELFNTVLEMGELLKRKGERERELQADSLIQFQLTARKLKEEVG
jgi:hypothetical protein